MRGLNVLAALGLLDFAAASSASSSFSPLHSGGAHLSRRAAKSTVSCKNGFHYTPDRSACVCPEGKYISLDGNKCLSHCSLGSYILAGNPACQACPNEESWARCSSTTVATACNDGWFLSSADCVKRCPSGTWEDENRCRACADPDAITCSSSKQGATTACLTKYLFEGICIDAEDIPDGYFPNPDRHVAEPCAAGIATCTGAEKDEATSCKSGGFLTSDGICASSCEAGFYGHTTLNACNKCDSSMKTCDEHGAIECAKTPEGSQLYLTPRRHCILPNKGAAGYYADDATKSFKECDEGVAECIGSGAGNALACGKLDNGIPLFWTHTGPYASISASGNDVGIRHRKRGDSTPVAGSCVEETNCPAGTWADLVTSACVACDDGEASCRGNGSGSAITCKEGLFLTIDDDCVTAQECKASGAFFADHETGACSTCDAGEASCDGNGRGLANSCAKNDSGEQLYLYQRDCVVATDCPGNYYPDEAKLACKPCDAFVLQCKGPGQALSCGVNSQNTQLYLNEGKCVVKEECPSTTYADPRQRDCASCSFIHPDAKTCSSPFTLSCKTLFYQDIDCVPSKNCCEGTYGRESDRICASCIDFGSDVATCDKYGALTCKTGNLEDRRCVPECKAGSFAEDHVCHPCSTRFDFAATCEPHKITLCNDQHYLQEDVCVEQCDADRFATDERTCLPCVLRFPGSKTCEQRQPLTCLPSHVFLSGSTNQCLTFCPETHYEEDGICEPCSEAIPYARTCSSKTVPTSCSDSRFVDLYSRCSPRCRNDSTATLKIAADGHMSWTTGRYIDGSQGTTQCAVCKRFTLLCDLYTGESVQCVPNRDCH